MNTQVFRDNRLNNLQVSNSTKVPRYRSRVDVGDEPGMEGNIIYDRSSNGFYGHDGTTWVPFGGGGSGDFVDNLGSIIDGEPVWNGSYNPQFLRRIRGDGNISVTSNANSIIIEGTGGSGDIVANAGSPTEGEEIYKNGTNNPQELRTLVAMPGIAIQRTPPPGDAIEISTDPAFADVVANVGGGREIYTGSSSPQDLRTLVEGDGIVLSQNTETIEIATNITGGPGVTVVQGSPGSSIVIELDQPGDVVANAGSPPSGARIYIDDPIETGDPQLLRTLVAGDGILLTENPQDIEITANITGGPGVDVVPGPSGELVIELPGVITGLTNVGIGSEVYRTGTTNPAELRTIVAGPGIQVDGGDSPDTDEITISLDLTPSGGVNIGTLAEVMVLDNITGYPNFNPQEGRYTTSRSLILSNGTGMRGQDITTTNGIWKGGDVTIISGNCRTDFIPDPAENESGDIYITSPQHFGKGSGYAAQEAYITLASGTTTATSGNGNATNYIELATSSLPLDTRRFIGSFITIGGETRLIFNSLSPVGGELWRLLVSPSDPFPGALATATANQNYEIRGYRIPRIGSASTTPDMSSNLTEIADPTATTGRVIVQTGISDADRSGDVWMYTGSMRTTTAITAAQVSGDITISSGNDLLFGDKPDPNDGDTWFAYESTTERTGDIVIESGAARGLKRPISGTSADEANQSGDVYLAPGEVLNELGTNEAGAHGTADFTNLAPGEVVIGRNITRTYPPNSSLPEVVSANDYTRCAHVRTEQTHPPTLNALTGTSDLVNGSTDFAGKIFWNSASGSTSLDVTFNRPYKSDNIVVLLTAGNQATGAASMYIINKSATGFRVRTGSGLSPGSDLEFDYMVVALTDQSPQLIPYT